MFKMLLSYLYSRERVNVYHEKRNKYYNKDRYSDIFKIYRVKKIIKEGYKFYIIPYKPRPGVLMKQREKKEEKSVKMIGWRWETRCGGVELFEDYEEDVMKSEIDEIFGEESYHFFNPIF